jgi:hypothetical protein
MLIFPPFHHWPGEAAIVGRLLVDYGELEIELALSMGYAISDKRKGMRDFFRTRGAEARIRLAEEQANPEERPWMRLTGVGDEFAEAVAALRVCKDIRNGFAHCHWVSEKYIPECPAGLYFVDVISTQRGQPFMGECPMPSKRPAPALSCPVPPEVAVILARYDP